MNELAKEWKNDSLSQSINQSNLLSVSQAIKLSIRQSNIQGTHDEKKWMSETKWMDEWMNTWTKESNNQWINQPITQSINKATNQAIV